MLGGEAAGRGRAGTARRSHARAPAPRASALGRRHGAGAARARRAARRSRSASRSTRSPTGSSQGTSSTLPPVSILQRRASTRPLYSGAAAALATVAALPVALLVERHRSRATRRDRALDLHRPGAARASWSRSRSSTSRSATCRASTSRASSSSSPTRSCSSRSRSSPCAPGSRRRRPGSRRSRARSGTAGSRCSCASRCRCSRPALVAGFSLVFISASTELTATLILHPTGVKTLATGFWAYTNDFSYGAAAPYALALLLVATAPGAAARPLVRADRGGRVVSAAHVGLGVGLRPAEVVRRAGRARRRLARGRGRLADRDPRRLGKRQDDAAAPDRRLRARRRGHDLARRPASSTGREQFVPPERRRIGYVPQEGALFPHLTRRRQRRLRAAVRQARREPGGDRRARRRAARAGRARRVREAAAAPALGRRAPAGRARPRARRATRRSCCSTSRSRRSTSSCARACAARSSRCSRTAGATAILVTHDQDEALSIADRVAVLQHGTIVQCDEPARALHAAGERRGRALRRPREPAARPARERRRAVGARRDRGRARRPRARSRARSACSCGPSRSSSPTARRRAAAAARRRRRAASSTATTCSSSVRLDEPAWGPDPAGPARVRDPRPAAGPRGARAREPRRAAGPRDRGGVAQRAAD